MKKLNIQKEAKKPKFVEIGDGFYVNKVGKDPNGNSCVWVQKGAGRSKKIQLVGVIPNKKDIITEGIEFFQDKNDPDIQKSIKALKDYYKKYLMKDKKSNVAVSYPREADAEFLVDLTNHLSQVYTGGSQLGSKMMDQLTQIRMSKWDEVFGDKSPWIAVRSKKKGKIMDVKWSDEKAKKLGIGVFK